jgi:hypothetical protein
VVRRRVAARNDQAELSGWVRRALPEAHPLSARSVASVALSADRCEGGDRDNEHKSQDNGEPTNRRMSTSTVQMLRWFRAVAHPRCMCRSWSVVVTGEGGREMFHSRSADHRDHGLLSRSDYSRADRCAARRRPPAPTASTDTGMGECARGQRPTIRSSVRPHGCP